MTELDRAAELSAFDYDRGYADGALDTASFILFWGAVIACAGGLVWWLTGVIGG